ncbi:hypothetical protein EJB05_36878 [Eragrostis curvula]|uniref:Uncharacterized protein n=1 Tax=Eragrostis curvula TaxID=38414 RepID=A0A5J9UBT1_9POAL|nr:hypothetical protein EJB05_36878 [Eragrostis curvula]
MGRRGTDRWRGASVRCGIAIVLLIFVCRLLVATDAAASLGPGAEDLATAEYSGGRAATADAFRSSKRRIPKGPDPIHNRVRYTGGT